MSEVWSYPPTGFKPDPSKPARLIETEDGKLLLEFFDVEGRRHRIPLVMAIFPPEFSALKDQLPLTDFWQVIGVDELYVETSKSVEINTGTTTPPYTLLTPSSGKRIETRGVYIFTDSDAGEIWVEFPSSGQVVVKMYASKFKTAAMYKVKFRGNVGEALRVNWTGLSSGSKIFITVVYREV